MLAIVVSLIKPRVLLAGVLDATFSGIDVVLQVDRKTKFIDVPPQVAEIFRLIVIGVNEEKFRAVDAAVKQ